MSRYLVIVILMCCGFSVAAQERKLVRKGNELYSQQRYGEAAAAYQQAVQKNPSFLPGTFNLGNTLIQQKQYDAARKVMDRAAKTAPDNAVRAGARYNIGNTFMAQQQWQEAVDAYKQALRANPQDADAKYNLSYALAKLKQQQQQGGGGKDKNKDPQKDQNNKDNKDKKDDQDKQQQKDQKDQQQKDQQQKNDQQQGDGEEQKDGKEEPKHKEPQPSKLSPQQADNLLKALEQDERKLQDKMRKERGMPVRTDKDW